MSKKRKKNLTLLAVLAALTASGVFYWQTRAQGQSEPAPQIVTATRGDLRITISATGTIEPNYIVEIKPKASGEVSSVPVQVGDQVRQGQLLVKIDPIIEKRRVNQALSEVRMARARGASAWHKRKFALTQLKRERALLGKGLVSAERVATLEKELAVLAGDSMVAPAQLAKAKEALKEARDRLAETKIVAPTRGTILERQVQPGQVVSSAKNSVSGGTVLFKMADLSKLFVRVKVDEADVPKVRAGLSVEITADGLPRRRFRGQVVRVAPQGVIESNVTVFEVLVAVGQRGSKVLKPNMSANVDVLIEERKDVVLIPQRALKRLRGRRYQVTLGNGTKTDVRIGRTQGGMAEVISGLQAGDKVALPVIKKAAGGNRQRGNMRRRGMRRMMGGRR